jgi:acyl phosphate:glycerol-3-phosphate acyltransferase
MIMEWKLMAAFSLAYLVGSFPTSIVICRALKGIDIRCFGSGNAGATNVYRVMGLKVALLVLFTDALKGVFGVFVPWLLTSETVLWQMILGGLLAIVGHIWTVFAQFKGGKGIGPSLGVFFALTPIPAAMAFLTWIAVVAVTRIVSMASMLAGLTLAVVTWVLSCWKLFGTERPLAYFTTAVALLILFTHRKNIQRLLNGTENKISLKKERP